MYLVHFRARQKSHAQYLRKQFRIQENKIRKFFCGFKKKGSILKLINARNWIIEWLERLRKKLEQIKSTAQKVKNKKEEPSSAATGGCAVQEESGSLKTKAINTGPGLVCSGLDYVSPLEHVRAEREPAKVFDPDTMLCRFELGGKCVDSACIYQHVAPK